MSSGAVHQAEDRFAALGGLGVVYDPAAIKIGDQALRGQGHDLLRLSEEVNEILPRVAKALVDRFCLGVVDHREQAVGAEAVGVEE